MNKNYCEVKEKKNGFACCNQTQLRLLCKTASWALVSKIKCALFYVSHQTRTTLQYLYLMCSISMQCLLSPALLDFCTLSFLHLIFVFYFKVLNSFCIWYGAGPISFRFCFRNNATTHACMHAWMTCVQTSLCFMWP